MVRRYMNTPSQGSNSRSADAANWRLVLETNADSAATIPMGDLASLRAAEVSRPHSNQTARLHKSHLAENCPAEHELHDPYSAIRTPGLCVTCSGISKTRWTGVPLQRGKSVVKRMPRVEIFSDSAVWSSAIDVAVRTRSGILSSNRSARRRSARVMGATLSLTNKGALEPN